MVSNSNFKGLWVPLVTLARDSCLEVVIFSGVSEMIFYEALPYDFVWSPLLLDLARDCIQHLENI